MDDFFKNLIIENKDLNTNSANRVPICIVVDTSFSMNENDRIGEVSKGLASFIRDGIDNEYAVDSIELCIIAFEDNNAVVIQPFANLRNVSFKPLKASGQTPLGKGVSLALEEIDEILRKYTNAGIMPYKPRLVIMSDGAVNDDISKVSREVRNRISNRSLKVSCIDMGNGGKTDLDKFTIDGSSESISSFDMKNFFSMLSRSCAALSLSSPGEDN